VLHRFFEQRPDSSPHERVIVDDQHTKIHAATPDGREQ
jgi:hypothetical protein